MIIHEYKGKHPDNKQSHSKVCIAYRVLLLQEFGTGQNTHTAGLLELGKVYYHLGRLPTVAFSHLNPLYMIHVCVTLLQIITVTIIPTTMTTTFSVTMDTVNPRTMSVMDMMTAVTTVMRKTAVLKVVHLANNNLSGKLSHAV